MVIRPSHPPRPVRTPSPPRPPIWLCIRVTVASTLLTFAPQWAPKDSLCSAVCPRCRAYIRVPRWAVFCLSLHPDGMLNCALHSTYFLLCFQARGVVRASLCRPLIRFASPGLLIHHTLDLLMFSLRRAASFGRHFAATRPLVRTQERGEEVESILLHCNIYWRLFYIEREPGSGSIQFSAYGCIAPTHRLTCVASMTCARTKG